MSKTILIALLVVFLAGGGIAFAQYGPVTELLGLVGENPPEIDDEEMGPEFEKEVSELAREITTEGLPEQAQAATSEVYENEDERSDVAKAVLEVLGGEYSPEDGKNFGDNVSSQAQEDGRKLGKDVSEAARGANPSGGNGN